MNIILLIIVIYCGDNEKFWSQIRLTRYANVISTKIHASSMPNW